jgi:hypothetical protein
MSELKMLLLEVTDLDIQRHNGFGSAQGMTSALNDPRITSGPLAQATIDLRGGFTHWCDPDGAVDELANMLTYADAAQMAALSPLERHKAVKRAWTHFVNYFCRLNVRIHAFRIWRRICEQHWGTEQGGLARNRPVWTSGDWRTQINARFQAIDLGRGEHRYADAVVFGDPVRASEKDSPRDDYTLGGPTTDIHRFFALQNGTLGGYDYGPDEMLALQNGGDAGIRWRGCSTETFDCLTLGWRAYGTWSNYFVCYGIPPLKWYWDMLFAPIPGLRLGAAYTDLYKPGETGGISLAEYLTQLGPVELVRAVRIDVQVTNDTLQDSLAVPENQLIGAADAQSAEEKARATNTAAAAAGIGSGVGQGIMTMAGATPWTAAIGLAVGVASMATAAIAKVFSGQNIDDGWARDVFARKRPHNKEGGWSPDTFEFFRLVDGGLSSLTGMLNQLTLRNNAANLVVKPVSQVVRESPIAAQKLRAATTWFRDSSGAVGIVPFMLVQGAVLPSTTTGTSTALSPTKIALGLGLVAGLGYGGWRIWKKQSRKR